MRDPSSDFPASHEVPICPLLPPPREIFCLTNTRVPYPGLAEAEAGSHGHAAPSRSISPARPRWPPQLLEPGRFSLRREAQVGTFQVKALSLSPETAKSHILETWMSGRRPGLTGGSRESKAFGKAAWPTESRAVQPLGERGWAVQLLNSGI